MVGHPGAASGVCLECLPALSPFGLPPAGYLAPPSALGAPIRTARIAVFLVPDVTECLVKRKVESRGVAPRSAPCRDAVLLLNDDPVLTWYEIGRASR